MRLRSEFPAIEMLSRAIVTQLIAGDSVLFSVPRYSLCSEIVDCAAHSFAESANAGVVPVKIAMRENVGGTDYAFMWRSIAGYLTRPPKGQANDLVSFEANWKVFLRRVHTPILVLLEYQYGLELERYRILQLFHHLGRFQRMRGLPPFLFVAQDDFSLRMHEAYTGDIKSELEGMKRESRVALSQDEIEGLILAGTELDPENARVAARSMWQQTGGHVGLVSEVWKDLNETGWQVLSTYWAERLPRILANSYVLEGIRRDIKEDPIGLCRTALEFIKPRYPTEYETPRFRLLCSLGILQAHSESEFCLCEGVIRNVLQTTLRESAQKRVGSVEAADGYTIFENAPPSVHDDEIVVIHLSDVHVGADYAHRFKAPGEIFNQGKGSLGELIARDLELQGLEGRINGIIISGDISCNGSHDELLRAREIIQELLERTGVASKNLAIVAGNHDLQWSPPIYSASAGHDKHVSREAFEIFLELMGKKGDMDAALTSLLSPNGKSVLKVVTMDSNFVEGPEAAGIGFVSRNTLSLASKALADDKSGDFERVFRWAVVHHHVLPVSSMPVEEAHKRNVSVLGNAPEVLAWCREARIEAILHGHEHQPGITLARRWTADSSDVKFWPVAVIGAGSCGAKRERLGPVSQNHYYLLIRRSSDMLIRSRVMGYEGIGFITHKDISIRLELPRVSTETVPRG